MLEVGHQRVERFDLASEVVDAARCGALRELSPKAIFLS